MKRVMLVMLSGVLAGCAGPPRPFPSWSGDNHEVSSQTTQAALRDQDADTHLALASLTNRSTRPLNILVLSSGGQNGAFGAGLIEGWGASGTRPEFDLVTGASTGALMAVFAFLGDDATLKAMYTTHVTGDVFTPYPWVSVLSSSAYAASTPLRESISRYITEETVAAVAREGAAGRVLLVSTSNLDLNVMRVWNLTALAADPSRTMAERTQRIRDIITAALSLPGLVPPVFIDGCMHADGGVVRQVFLIDSPHADDLAAVLRPAPGPNVWVVVNRRIGSPARVVRNQIIPIASRSIQMMVDAALVRDIEDVQRSTGTVGGRFWLASLPVDPDRRAPEGFLDPVYMKQVHALGFGLGSSPGTWVDSFIPPLPEARQEPKRR